MSPNEDMTVPNETPLTSEDVAYNQPYLSLLPAGDILNLMRQQTTILRDRYKVPLELWPPNS